MISDRDRLPRSRLAVFADFSLLFAKAALWGLVASLAASAFVLFTG